MRALAPNKPFQPAQRPKPRRGRAVYDPGGPFVPIGMQEIEATIRHYRALRDGCLTERERRIFEDDARVFDEMKRYGTGQGQRLLGVRNVRPA